MKISSILLSVFLSLVFIGCQSTASTEASSSSQKKAGSGKCGTKCGNCKVKKAAAAAASVETKKTVSLSTKAPVKAVAVKKVEAPKKVAVKKPAMTLPSKLVFSSNRSDAWRIWTCNPDGSDLKQLLEGEKDEEHDVDPAWSPDGTWVLFTSTRGGKAGLWRIGEDGKGLKRICDGDQGDFSPSGKKIAFRKNLKIFTRDLASGAEKQVVPNEYKICTGPTWSPDGSRLAFACRWDAGNSVFTVPADGSKKPFKVYDKKGACEPEWSPNGKKLVYETETHICTVQPDGKKNRLITYYGGVQRYARWNANGTRLVFSQGMTEKGPWVLYTVGATGGPPTKVTSDGSDMNADWRGN